MKKQEKLNKQSGRPRVGWPVIEGITACAAQLQIPASLIREAKRNGSLAFLTGNRVDTAILIPDLFKMLVKHPAEELLDAAQEAARLNKARRVQQELETAEHVKQLVSRDELEETLWQNSILPIRSMLVALRKSTPRLVDAELERAQVPQEVREAVKAMQERAIDEGLAAVRNAYPNKPEEPPEQNEGWARKVNKESLA